MNKIVEAARGIVTSSAQKEFKQMYNCLSFSKCTFLPLLGARNSSGVLFSICQIIWGKKCDKSSEKSESHLTYESLGLAASARIDWESGLGRVSCQPSSNFFGFTAGQC